MIRYIDYSRLAIDMFQGYRVLEANEVLENFDQEMDDLDIYIVRVKNLGGNNIHLIFDKPELASLSSPDVEYYEETLLSPKEDEKDLTVCFLKEEDAKIFDKKIRGQKIIFPKFVPQTVIIGPE